jgi:hypothetical protein
MIGKGRERRGKSIIIIVFGPEDVQLESPFLFEFLHCIITEL